MFRNNYYIKIITNLQFPENQLERMEHKKLLRFFGLIVFEITITLGIF